MFTPQLIHARVTQKPFIPLRIVTSSGQTYDVYHPDLILIGQRDMVVGIPSKKDPAIYAEAARVALMHVTALEDLPTKKKSKGNGQTFDS